MLGLAAGLTACQKDASTVEPATASSLTVTIPQEMQSRAIADYGTGSQINRCILEIYHNGTLYGDRKIVDVTGGQATFNDLQLVASQSYNLVLWADCGDESNGDLRYNTSDLTAITMNTYTGNDDSFDAFCATKEITVSGSFIEPITLSRPLSQLTVKTLDMAAVDESLQPTHVTMTIDAVPTQFNLLTGELSNPQQVTYTIEPEAIENGELTVDYLWAPDSESNLVNFEMEFLNNGTTITTNDQFTNIPLRRNYRTNVTGNLLTKKGTINVTVDSNWADGDITSSYQEVTAAELQSVLNGLSTTGIVDYNLTVVDALPASGNYELPALAEGSTISLALNGAEGEVTFGDADFAGTLELTSSSESTITINIDVPQGDATIGAGKWNIASASTKPTTLTIAPDAEVEAVAIEKGNVNIMAGAEVTTLTRTATNTDAETLVNLFDGAQAPTISDNKIKTQEAVTGQIVNTTTGKNFATIRDAVAAAAEGDVIELAEGDYDLGEPGQIDAAGPYGYYLKINTPLTIKGNGKVTITTSHEAASNIGGVGSLQNLLTVAAPNVTLENLTFVANYNGYYEGPNKIIEVCEANFTIKNCVFEPNTKAPEDCGGAVYFSQKADNGLVEGCTINKGTISFDGLMSGNFLIRKNTFNYGFSNLMFTTPNWTSNDTTTSTMKVNVEENTFNGFEAYNGENYPTVRVYYGIFNLTNNTFPTDGIYWNATNYGAVYVDYDSVISQLWSKDRSEPKSFAISNNIVTMETETAPANNWYSWQGRKAQINNGLKNSWSVETTLTIPEATRPVRQSVWLNLCDANGSTIDWPIIGYKIEEEGATGFFETWDSEGEGAWNKVEMASVNVNPGDQATFKFVFDNGTLYEYINGTLVNQYTVSAATTNTKEIIFNSYSYGESYLTTWSYPVVK